MFKFYVEVFYVTGKTLSGELSFTGTGLVVYPVTSRSQTYLFSGSVDSIYSVVSFLV